MDQPQPFLLRICTQHGFAQAEERARALLAEAGFGVLTEIDVAATLKSKLGLDTAPCRILGACNPRFAHQAMELDPSVSVLLPCNFVIRDLGGYREVLAMDPAYLGSVLPIMAELGQQVGALIRGMLEALEGEAPTD